MTTKQKTKEVVRVGNLVDHPEIRFTPTGVSVCIARLAFTPYNRETKTQGETVYYGLTIWRQLGEHVAASLTAGARVIVVGEPSTRTWTTREGEERTEKEITVTAIGPDLRFAIATVTKVGRETSSSTEQEEMF